MTIQLARIKDIKALRALEEDTFITDRLSTQQFKHFIRVKNAWVLTYKLHKTLIASAIVLFRKNSKIVRLYSIAVDNKHRHQGIGKALHHYIEAKLQQTQHTEIRLEVRKDNHEAIRFYNKHHYAIFGVYKKFYEDKTDALRMRKTLILNGIGKDSR